MGEVVNVVCGGCQSIDRGSWEVGSRKVGSRKDSVEFTLAGDVWGKALVGD